MKRKNITPIDSREPVLAVIANVHERLQYGARFLNMLDRKRAECESAGVGSSVERSLIGRELYDLEKDLRRCSVHPRYRGARRRRSTDPRCTCVAVYQSRRQSQEAA